jgi:hypothetical protein
MVPTKAKRRTRTHPEHKRQGEHESAKSWEHKRKKVSREILFFERYRIPKVVVMGNAKPWNPRLACNSPSMQTGAFSLRLHSLFYQTNSSRISNAMFPKTPATALMSPVISSNRHWIGCYWPQASHSWTHWKSDALPISNKHTALRSFTGGLTDVL